MSLGVLNNISAIYAENNLNQTNASLQNTLTQLSSGSRINSGADDAAGLSLADGLGANAAALTQSATNASSGVGLLQVADGALSQVNNLLNRAVTLATEASNGTLNQSQDASANQEYQSILTEVNNIGGTTSYNGNAVFGSTTAIFTGDASAIGSSVDTLSIKGLSSSSVGDVGGTITAATTANIYTGSAISSTSKTAAATTLTFQTAPSYGNIAGTVGTTNEVFTASSASDTFTLGANAFAAASNGAITTPQTLTQLAATLNADAVFSGANKFTATVNSAGTQLTIADAGTNVTAPTAATLTAATTGASVSIAANSTVDSVATQINSANISGISASVQTAGGYSSLVINDAGGALQTFSGLGAANNGLDTANGFGAGAAGVSFTASGGSATNGISYTEGTGVDLSSTKLTDSTAAKAALTSINTAIADVAAQRGYLGSQINTLNSAANVASTEQTNVVSAQNNILATDYGQATSDLSKYQILSQTGISALAQAQTVQQEVLKLLQ